MIRVVGIGPGNPQWLPPAILEAIQDCEVLFGGMRALQLFSDLPGEKFPIRGALEPVLEGIKEALREGKRVGVLVSGDPGFYSLLPLLRRNFSQEEIKVYPGLSSLQLAFARLGIPWQEAQLLSVHGRSLDTLPLNVQKPIGVLTGGGNSPQKIAEYYCKYRFNPPMVLGNALTYPEEKWLKTDAQTLMQREENFSNSVLIILPELNEDTSPFQYKGLGIKDEFFIRGNIPMTKNEVRVQVLAKARIKPKSRILDVGAGTGSLSIEAALLAQEGCVFAVEQEPEGQELILQNKAKFQVHNLHLIPGRAPDVFMEIPPVDICLVGGSDGELEEILSKAPLKEGGKVVITAVTLETLSKGLQALPKLGYEEVEVVSIQAVRWRGIKDFHLAQAQNPVFILSAVRGGR
ncbi:MAG: precorrin-6y C5,15-methyltransferase (decarboxylating) subunit CbiE [Desulfitobacterium sp.]|nr:precorrin-6y C5,15-methyltransferase (decarboxylating) subunit CbiE [Desulfitobacterium sp.]